MSPVIKPETAEGERYIGAIVDAQGTTTHIILLPGSTKADWKSAMKWAASIGGDLPNRVEQALLFATANDEFEAAAYWSNVSESGWAWFQGFDTGNQVSTRKRNGLRARAVRRLTI